MDLVARYAAEFSSRFGGQDPEELASNLGIDIQDRIPNFNLEEDEDCCNGMQFQNSIIADKSEVVLSPIPDDKAPETSEVCLVECKKVCSCVSPNTACRRILSAKRKLQRKRKRESEKLALEADKTKTKESLTTRQKQKHVKIIVDYINKVCLKVHPDDRKEIISMVAEHLPEFGIIGKKELQEGTLCCLRSQVYSKDGRSTV